MGGGHLFSELPCFEGVIEEAEGRLFSELPKGVIEQVEGHLLLEFLCFKGVLKCKN